ncbi:MAG: ATP-binding protein, partial [Cyanobacteria bacterium P01_D01_bin.56]
MISEPVPPQSVPPYFLQEASELLQQMDDELQTLRQDFNIRKVHTLMRIAHTLKGASASVGLDAIKTTTHSLEDAFKALCAPDASLTVVVEGLIFDAYACLQLLLSAQFTNTPLDESSILDRMAGIVAQLQENLGDQFGNDGYLPSSADLGFDMTQSIFEMGVTERLNELESALQHPDPDSLRSLLESQAELFFGLAESLCLPGFGEIAQATQTALKHNPEQVTDIAQAALDDYRAGQAKVLQGDRTQGGSPGLILQNLRSPAASPEIAQPPKKSPLEVGYQPSSPKAGRVSKLWQLLTRPIPGTPRILNSKTSLSSQTVEETETSLSNQTVEETDPFPSTYPEPTPRAEEKAVTPSLETTTHHLVQADVTVPETQAEIPIAASDINVFEQPLPLQEASLESIESKKNVHPNNTSTLRVSVDHLDQLNYVIGELLTQQNRQALYHEELSTSLNNLSERILQQQKHLYELQRHTLQENLKHSFHSQQSAVTPYQFDALEFEQYNELQLLVQPALDNMIQQLESFEAVELFVRHSQQLLAKQQRFVDSLRDTLFDIRMQPLEPLIQRFEPVVARLSGQYQKAVDLAIEGAHVRIDKAIADKLYDPLLHLMRNAFSHGIESSENRQQQNKPLAGKINVNASQSGRYLVIKVTDDGRGLDLEAIGKKAVENRLLSPQELTQLSSEEFANLIFEPGFSTANHIDDLSGRGMGLNAVRSQVETLGGHVTVSSQMNHWTCFTLRIPTNLTIAKLLLCQSGDKHYGLMTDTVQQIVMPTAKQISTREQVKLLSWRFADKDRLVPVVSLTEVLKYRTTLPSYPLVKPVASAQTTALHPIILIHNEGQYVGLEVDNLQDEQELAIHPLGKVVSTPTYVYGCSTLPDGQLTLVLDGTILVQEILSNLSQTVLDLFDVRDDKPPIPTISTVSQKTVLIVDDSITVRNTLTETLQKAGYT